MGLTQIAYAAVGWTALVAAALAQPVEKIAKATRVAVLHVGPAGAGGMDDLDDHVLNITAPVEEVAQAVEELKTVGAEVVVLRINSGGGLGADVLFLDLMEKSLVPRFRVVAWVRNAFCEAALLGLAAPELCMTTDASMSAIVSSPWATPRDSVMVNWLKQGERAAAMGRRPPAIVKAMQVISPLSVTERMGERRFFGDDSGEVVLNPKGEVLRLDAAKGLWCGVSLCTVDTRAELVAALKLEKVEWVGEEIDRRLQERCEKARKAMARASELVRGIVLHARDLNSGVLDPDARTVARTALAKQWEELSALRRVWPRVSDWWCSLMGLSWEDVAAAATEAAPKLPPKREPHRSTRVAVLNIGVDEVTRERLKRPEMVAASVPLSAYARAAAELKEAGADVVVLKINEEYGCGTGAFVDLIEGSFLPNFRTVGWVDRAIDESGVAALAFPEVCMTPHGYWGRATCHVWNRKTCDALAARAAAAGKRPRELARAFVYATPLSVSVVNGKREYRCDAGGDLVITACDGVGLNAQLAEEAGVSIGTAETREELARLLGVVGVEWIGADVDARVQVRCEAAGHDLQRVRDLLTQVRLAAQAVAAPAQLSQAQLALARAKRDVAWAKIQQIREAWPELSGQWPPLLAQGAGWGANWDATWELVAQEAGVEKNGAGLK